MEILGSRRQKQDLDPAAQGGGAPPCWIAEDVVGELHRATSQAHVDGPWRSMLGFSESQTQQREMELHEVKVLCMSSSNPRLVVLRMLRFSEASRDEE